MTTLGYMNQNFEVVKRASIIWITRCANCGKPIKFSNGEECYLCGLDLSEEDATVTEEWDRLPLKK